MVRRVFFILTDSLTITWIKLFLLAPAPMEMTLGPTNLSLALTETCIARYQPSNNSDLLQKADL